MLGKLGNLFAAGRRRNTRNGLESPTSSSAKSASPRNAAPSPLPEPEDEKSTSPGSPARPAARCGEGLSQEQPQEPEGERSEPCVQVAPRDAHLSPCLSSRAAAAGRPCPGNESPQLEPVHSEGEPFPDATAAAKQLHSSLENSPRRENAQTLARSPGEDALPGAAGAPEAALGAGGVPGSPAARGPGEAAAEGGGSLERLEARIQPAEGASAPPGDRPAEGAENRTGAAQVCRPGERAPPAAKVLTLDIYLSKTEGAQVDEPVIVTPGAEDWDDQDDMERRASGRRPGRRRKSQKSADSPSPDTALPPDGAARDDAVFDYEVAPNAANAAANAAAAAEHVSAEKKVKSPRAAPDGGVAVTAAAAASSESRSSPGSKGQPRGEPERSKQPLLPAASPTKRRGKVRGPEAVPTPSAAGGPRAPAKESPPRRPCAPDCSPSPSPAAKAAAGESAEEAPRVIPRELPIRSCSLLPEIKPEHKRGPLPSHLDGRGEGSRSKELGRPPAGPDAEGLLKPRNHFGAGRSTVTTKVTL